MAIDIPSQIVEWSDEDLKSLANLLTLQEKISLLSLENVWETAPIPRLNIPSLKVTDGPNGARGGHFFDGKTAACFPACVSIAATFNPDLARRVGVALGEECETKGAYVLLGPTVCCHRSPLGGRNFEGFSEDPLVSGSLASAYVIGLQSQRVGATVKHYLGNEQDTRRFTLNGTISERALREIYLRPFEQVVKESQPWCVMTSYPKVNGNYVDATPDFIQTILRKQWGYDGFVMSDWGSTSCMESIENGLDMEMPGPPRIRTPKAIKLALEEGQISTVDINASVNNFLKLLKRTGKFGDRRETPMEIALDRPEHRKLIREAGAEGCVLLKNKNSILPLDGSSLKKIALLGPLANYAAAHGGGSASLRCHYKVTPIQAFTHRLGSGVSITSARGAHIFRIYPDLEQGTTNLLGEPGFLAEYFMTRDLTTKPFRIEKFPRGSLFTFMNTEVVGTIAFRFSTIYTPPETGKHYLSFSGLGSSRLFINDDLIFEQETDTTDVMGFFLGVQDEHRFTYFFESSKSYDIRIESFKQFEDNNEHHLFNGQLGCHLGFVSQEEMEADLIAEAVSLAKDADYAFVFVGNTTQWETEGQDLSSMVLPADGSQDALIAAVAAVNPNTIVVTTTGTPFETPWIDDVAALIQGWYAGQETGNSMLDVLLGEVTPSGKLPMSWPKKNEHTACYGNFGLDALESGQVAYVEGVFVGYRHFDRLIGTEQEVRFPFGFGLSFTTFDITNIAVKGAITATDQVTVSGSVKNTGSRSGAEVVQIYLSPPKDSRAERPIKSLVGYSKVFLQPGEEKEFSVSFAKDAAVYWDEDIHMWRAESGEHRVITASSSGVDDIVDVTPLNIEGFTFDP
ncbi:hypothetical protein EJ08DRAFT_583929 [Tothia fuscella]|uniref:beta-glucosidase n=1 Tax=Tothia fuscella TaxID=1048955 RepID=A0A9P4NX72_9PEZI|nr:hypothetical protein EJ08DRAFT_583929 [Tothia fuscella]